MADHETPASLGFRMPPAWAPHARSWMAWPCRAALWADGLEAARAAYAEVARAIARFEPVIVAARPADARDAQKQLGAGIEVWQVPLDDSWARDIAPVFVAKKGAVAGVGWDFNGWGGKHRPYGEDAAFAGRLLRRGAMPRFEGGMVLEGGAIASDGAGTVLTTQECLLNPNRNPGMTRDEIEARLKDFLGASRVVWLRNGLAGDETDGHVDNVACFWQANAVLMALPTDKRDPNYAAMHWNAQWLGTAGIEVVGVPMPAPSPFTRSYINFAVTNGGLIVPAFGDPADDEAARIIARAFPGRDVVQIDANPIVAGGGGIHCITYEEPLP